jgi:hypothetical protein
MTWQEALDNYFLAHETMNETNRAWLRDHVVMDAPLIREMSAEQLDATFSKNGKTNHTRLLRTYVWQTMGLALSRPELKKKFVRELVRLGVECWVVEMPEDRESRIDLLNLPSWTTARKQARRST